MTAKGWVANGFKYLTSRRQISVFVEHEGAAAFSRGRRDEGFEDLRNTVGDVGCVNHLLVPGTSGLPSSAFLIRADHFNFPEATSQCFRAVLNIFVVPEVP